MKRQHLKGMSVATPGSGSHYRSSSSGGFRSWIMRLKHFIILFGLDDEGVKMFAEYGDEFEDDEDNDFGRVPKGQECDHCERTATHALGDHYYCDDHYDD